MDAAIHIVTIMGIFGIPSLFAIVSWSLKEIFRISREQKKNDENMRVALQILLRTNLIRSYKEHMKRNCITDEDLQLWENEYQVYHSMGQNGIMDSKREKILKLVVVDSYEEGR